MKKNLITFIACLAGLCSGFLLQAQTVPKADLLDVTYHADGSATDSSASSFAITTGPGGNPAVVYDSAAKRLVSQFAGGASYTSIYYKVDYQGNTAFKNTISNAFTLEIYAKATGAKTAYQDIVSSQESGGFGIEQAANGGSTQLWFGKQSSGYSYAGNQSIYSATDPQYYHIVFTWDGTTLKSYYNGVAGSTTTPPAGGLRFASDETAHWIAIGGDATTVTNGTSAQSGFNGDISVVRMYSTALTQTQITDLYNQIQARSALTKADELNNWVSRKLPAYVGLITDGTKKGEAQQFITKGDQLLEAMSTTDADITALLNNINSTLTDMDDVLASDTLPRFAVISDTHVGRDGWEPKVNRAMELLRNQSPKLDAVFICGDVTDWGTLAQYSQANTLFAPAAQSFPVYIACMGNHDWYDNDTCDKRFVSALNQPLDQFVDIKGYPFVLISSENGDVGTGAYGARTAKFLSDTLAYAAQHYPGKPIFLFMHVPVHNTVYGSYAIGGGDSWGQADLDSIVNKYPQLVLFAGHSHFPLGDPRSINQNKFTAINDGVIAYSEIEKGLSEGIHPPGNENVQEGCLVSIGEDKNVTVKRWDLNRDEEIAPQWVVEAPFDGTHFTYAGRTGGAAPTFAVGAKPKITAVNESGCTITYPQGSDDEVVHHYKIEVLDKDGNLLSSPSYTEFSRFYLNSDMPDSLSWDVSGLQSGTQYKIRVTAVDSYNNLSAPIVSDVFTTNEYTPDPSVTAPVADLLNVKFKTGGNAEDVSPEQFPVIKSSTIPSTKYDSSIHQYISYYNGGSSGYYKIDYQDSASFKSTLQNAFSLETYVKAESTDDMAPVSSQESGGFGIEQAGGGGALQLWFGVQSGGYKTLGTRSIYSATNPQYNHVVFTWDGTMLRSYFNGVPADSMTTGSGLRFSSTAGAQWIAIGGDSHDGSRQYAFTGEVATARMYSKAISRDEAIRLDEQFQNRAAMLNVDSLNTIIATTLPQLRNKVSDQTTLDKIDALLAEGWQLMDTLTTTDPEIQAYFEKVNTQLSDLLPVTLTNFMATLTGGNKVVLQWNSNVENNVKNYTVQRSSNGSQWEDIANVPVKGNNQQYTYEDLLTAAGTYYYRIRENQLDNTKLNVSDIRIIDAGAGSSNVNVYPNPTKGIVHLKTSNSVNPKSISVFDLSGKNIPAKITTDNNGLVIDLSKVNSGVYLIKFDKQVIKVIKL